MGERIYLFTHIRINTVRGNFEQETDNNNNHHYPFGRRRNFPSVRRRGFNGIHREKSADTYNRYDGRNEPCL